MITESVKILVVDDEADIVHLLKYNLSKECFNVLTAKDGEEGLAKIKEIMPDLVILDVVMPKLHGTEVCRIIKSDERYKNIPVIMLTAKSTEKNIVDGLNIGADDYVTKPFSIKVLIARVKALLRGKKEVKNEILKIGELELNLTSREVFLEGENIDFTFTRFELLALFLSNPNVAFSRKDIILKIKGDDYPVTERAIDVHIVELRKKLKSYAKNIKSIRGVGYKFVTEGIA